MRRSVQPNWPRAMTCCFFASLKMLAMAAEGPRSPSPRQRLERLSPMAGFHVSSYGRFWVSTEGSRHAPFPSQRAWNALRAFDCLDSNPRDLARLVDLGPYVAE